MNDNNSKNINNTTEDACKFCPGCGYPIVLMTLDKVLGDLGEKNKAILGLDIGCSLLAWNFLKDINTFQTHHGRVTPTIMGFKRAKEDAVCVGLTGDGGAYAIGLQSLLWSARRDEPITVLIVNNTVYAMTGGQTAPTTLKGQKTDTTPQGVENEPFYGIELLKEVIKPGAFLARTAVNDIKTLQEYIQKGIEVQKQGHFSAIEILSMCPTNWKTRGKDTLDKLNSLKDTFQLGEV